MRYVKAMLVTCGLLVLAGAMWLVLSPSAGTSGDEPRRAESPDDKGVKASQRRQSASEDGSGPTLETSRFDGAASSVEKEPPGVTVITGRCVAAEDGQPLAGVGLEFIGKPSGDQRVAAHRVEHGEITWEAPEKQRTGADGRFRFRIRPPPPYEFLLRLKHPERLPELQTWQGLAPGRTIALGDVALARGTRVRGRVVDLRDEPRGGVLVSAQRTAAPRGTAGTPRPEWGHAVTDADGRFEMKGALPPGHWRLRVSGLSLVDAAAGRLRLHEGQGVAELRLVVEEIERIRGVVVDPDGQPVRRALVSLAGSGASVAPKGRFDFARQAGSPAGPFELAATAPGYQPGRAEKEVAWGDEEVRIVLEPGPCLEVLVTESKSGKPFEDFGILIAASPSLDGPIGVGDRGLQARGHHPGGRAVLDPRRRGSYVVMAVPLEEGFVAGPLRRIELDERTSMVALTVHEAEERTIRVVGPEDRRVPGARVDLVLPNGSETLSMDSRVVTFDDVLPSRAEAGVRLAEGVTNADGEVVLRIAPAETPTLRLSSPLHRPEIVRDVRWPAAGQPLVVRVSRGSTIVGRLSPPAFLEQCRLPGDLVSNLPGHLRRPGVRLRPAGDRRGHFPIDGSYILVGKDGAFRIKGIPAGNWVLELRFLDTSGQGDLRAETRSVAEVHALEVEEVRRVEVNCSHLLKGRIRGRVLLDGAPPIGASVQLVSLEDRVTGGAETFSSAQIVMDADGRFEASVLPGRHRLVLRERSQEGVLRFHAPDLVEVAAGEEVGHAWRLESAELALVVQAADGETPIEGARLRLRLPEPHANPARGTTDARGRVRLTGCAGAVVDIEVLPKRFLDLSARRTHCRRTGRSEDSLWRPVARLTLVAGRQEQELTLPPEAGY